MNAIKRFVFLQVYRSGRIGRKIEYFFGADLFLYILNNGYRKR